MSTKKSTFTIETTTRSTQNRNELAKFITKTCSERGILSCLITDDFTGEILFSMHNGLIDSLYDLTVLEIVKFAKENDK